MSKWFIKHVTDFYVKKAQTEGYRARSVYKLKEIFQTHKINSDKKSVVRTCIGKVIDRSSLDPRLVAGLNI